MALVLYYRKPFAQIFFGIRIPSRADRNHSGTPNARNKSFDNHAINAFVLYPREVCNDVSQHLGHKRLMSDDKPLATRGNLSEHLHSLFIRRSAPFESVGSRRYLRNLNNSVTLFQQFKVIIISNYFAFCRNDKRVFRLGKNLQTAERNSFISL